MRLVSESTVEIAHPDVINGWRSIMWTTVTAYIQQAWMAYDSVHVVALGVLKASKSRVAARCLGVVMVSWHTHTVVVLKVAQFCQQFNYRQTCIICQWVITPCKPVSRSQVTPSRRECDICNDLQHKIIIIIVIVISIIIIFFTFSSTIFKLPRDYIYRW